MGCRGWPTTINPAWFGAEAPNNTLLSPDRPWVDVATADEAPLRHPNDRIASDPTVTMFRYNTYQRLIRTRVPPSISDQQALNLYNRLNRTDLLSIFPSAKQPAPAAEPVDEAPEEEIDPMSPLSAPSRT